MEACTWLVHSRARYSWIVDVYRTRVHDDQQRGDARGIMAVGPKSPASVVFDFLVFCSLGVSRGARWVLSQPT